MKRLLRCTNLIILISTAILATHVASGQSSFTDESKGIGVNNSDTLNVNFISNIKLYPVPVISDLSIDNISNVTLIEIFDVMGNRNISEACDHQDHLSISVSNLPRGIYFIRFTTSGTSAIKRFIKE
jgi:hypothetical protein